MHSDPFELNYSKVKAYLDCPYLYEYVYLRRNYPPHTAFSSLGISVHRALNRYHSEGGGLEELMLYYDEVWHHHGFESPAQALEFYGQGRRILENYRRAEREGFQADILFTEKEFEFEFERWRVRGTIDRVDRLASGGCELIDYKMGFDERTRVDLENDLQLAMYAIALKKAFGLEVRTISWMLLLKGEKLSAAYDPSGEERVLALLRGTGEKLLALDLSRKGNCAFCSIRRLCKEAKEGDGK